MSAKSWSAIVTESKSFLEVDFCDDAPQMEPLRRYRSEPDLSACRMHNNGACKSKSITMVDQFAGVAKNLNDDEVSINGFKSQHVSNEAGWHLRELKDEEIVFFGDDPAPMEHLPEDSHSQLPCEKKSRASMGQRMRQRKFMDKMVRLLRSDPDGFELDEINFPPSIAADSGRKARLVASLQSEKERILKDREMNRIQAPLVVGYRQSRIPSIGRFSADEALVDSLCMIQAEFQQDQRSSAASFTTCG